MNLFFLHLHPATSASYYFNKHCVKIILELAQVLYAAHWTIDETRLASCMLKPYKKTHVNHPLAIWTRRSLQNYSYVVEMALALCSEYTMRYHKMHKTQAHLEWLRDNPPTHFIESPYTSTVRLSTIESAPPGCTPVPLMVSSYLIDLFEHDLVQTYRFYYLLEKQKICDYPEQLRNLVDTWQLREFIVMATNQ